MSHIVVIKYNSKLHKKWLFLQLKLQIIYQNCNMIEQFDKTKSYLAFKIIEKILILGLSKKFFKCYLSILLLTYNTLKLEYKTQLQMYITRLFLSFSSNSLLHAVNYIYLTGMNTNIAFRLCNPIGEKYIISIFNC